MVADLPAVEQALLASHQPVSRLLALAPGGSVVQTWAGGTDRTARLTSGSVSYDRNKVGRRDGSFELANVDGALSPNDLSDLFAPGALVRLERGLRMSSQAVYLTLATLVVRSFGASMMGSLSVPCDSVLALLSQPLGQDVVLAQGTPAAEVLATLWGPVLEPLIGDVDTWDLDGGGTTLGSALVILEDEDILDVSVRTMTTLGLEVYEDRRGIPVLRPIPDPTTLPVERDYVQVGRDARFLTLERTSESQPYNGVVVIGKDGIRAETRITDPASPLHEDRIGRRIAPIFQSDAIPDQAAANAVARARLIEYSLLTIAITGSLPEDPMLDVGMVITAREAISGTDGTYLVDRVTHPVTTGVMDIAATRIGPVYA